MSVAWDSAIVASVVFEVQESVDSTEGNASVVLFTRGSMAVFTGVATNVRVRSIAPDGQKSSWSAWLAVSPVVAGASALDDLTDVNAPTPTDGQSLTYDTATSKWISSTVSGGGSGGGIVTTKKSRLTETELTTVEVSGSPASDITIDLTLYDTDYDELRITAYMPPQASSNRIFIEFNGDTSNHVSAVHYFGQAHSHGLVTNDLFISAPDGRQGWGKATIFNPFDPTKDASWIGHSMIVGLTTTYGLTTVGEWKNTAALTQIKFTNAVATLPIGTKITIYGLKNEQVVTDVTGGGGGGGAITVTTKTIQTETVIDKLTLSADGTFPSVAIPSGYDYIILRGKARSTKAVLRHGIYLSFNGDTVDANYISTIHYSGSIHGSARVSQKYIASIGGSTAVSNIYATFEGRVFDPDNATDQTLFLAQNHDDVGTTSNVRQYGLKWTNVSAITSLKIDTETGENFEAGSFFEVIGVKGEAVVTDVTGGGTLYSTNDVSSPPTKTEITTALGDPTILADGTQGAIDDAGSGTNVWLCTVSAGEWWYVAKTKAT